MPEIKQNFTRGKMNKDLDERLIPKGEYREAQNIHISESDSSDVGAIENVLGNIKINGVIAPDLTGDGSTLLTGSGYEVIGYCEDLRNKRVVYFITNFASDSFTDDIRSITRAQKAGTANYDANIEEHCAIILYDLESKINSTLVFGSWLNFSKNHLITGVSIIDDLLFWTDNLNQPRKININTALENYVSHEDQYYDCEETISVAKYAPYKTIFLHNDAGTAGTSRDTSSEYSEYMKERFIRFSYRYRYDDGEYSLIAPFTQSVFEPLNSGLITNSTSADEKNTTSGEPEVLTGKKEIYKKGIVDIMQNRINKVDLRIPLPNKNEFATTSPGSTYANPYHIQEIEILLKESNSTSFKLVKSIPISDIESTEIEVYTVQPKSTSSLYYRQVFKYTYNSSEPIQLLPEDQISRTYDQVPIVAKALDTVNNRLVFGNYVENYAHPVDTQGNKGMNYKVDVVTKGTVDQASKISPAAAPYLHGLKQWMNSIYKYHTLKQRRTYQVGIVFSDIFGRQSPVILSSNKDVDADTITAPEVTSDFASNADGKWNATDDCYGNSLAISFQDRELTSESKFKADVSYGIPYNPHGWYSYRIVVKQQEQEYYNIYAPHTFDGWDNINEEPNNDLTGGRSWLFLHGDNVNKVPRSLNDTDFNRDGTMGSNVRLYPKVIFKYAGTFPIDDRGESKTNDSYHELTEVISLGTAYEQNLYISGDDNKSGTGGFTVYKFVYGKDKNPLVAELQNMKAYTGSTSNNRANVFFARTDKTKQTTFNLDANQLGTAATIADDQLNGYSINFTSLALHTDVTVIDTGSSQQAIELSSPQSVEDADKLVFSKYYEGLSVFETEPFISKLDIYYETSTSGLVKDLTEEIVTDVNDLPTGLTIKQDTGYDFGTGQPAVSTSHPQYGTIAYLYENTEADNYIADLDATQSQTSIDAGATKDLTFSIQKATRLGDNANITNDLAVQEVSGVSKVKVVGTFVYRGNAFDDIELLVEVNDNNSGGTAFLTVTIQVANSKPTLDSLPASIEIQKDAGGNSNVIVSNNNFTNGGLVTGGAFNKYSDVDITRSFPGINLRDLITGQLINFEDYFVAEKTSVEGVYEVKTTAEWDVPNAARFFEQSAADRTMTITATDSGGLTTTTSTVINEDDIVTVRGRAYEYTFSDITEDNAWTTATSTGGGIYVWATTGTGLDPVNPYDEHFLENSGYIKLSTGNKLFSKSDLSSTLSAGKYLTIREIVEFGSRYDVDVIQVSSSGVVSILDTFTVLRFPK